MATLAQNIQRAIDNFNSIENAIVQKGVPVPDGTPTSEYGEKILSIETGVDTSGDTVVPSALREGYTAHDAAGQEITGTIPDYSGGNTVELTSPEGATLNTAGTYCEGNIEVVPKLQSKTATTGEIVTADDGYVGLSEVDTNPVFEAGFKSWMDAYIDSAIKNGNASRLFCAKGWSNETFRPTKNLRNFYYADKMFYDCGIEGDVAKIMEDCGVTFDFSQCSRCDQAVAFTKITRLGVMNFTRAYAGTHRDTFKKSIMLHTIDKFCVNEMWSYSDAFLFCIALEHLTIEGTIGQNGFNVSWSPLSKASITSIITHLSDTTTGLTVTLRLAAVNTAFETTAGAADGSTSDEWLALIATKPNWTINLINS